MKKLLIFLLSLLFLLLLTLLFIFMKEDQSLTDSSEKRNDVQTESGTENDSDKEGEQDSSGQTEEEKMDAKVQDLIAGMSLEEKVAQMFFVTPENLTGVDVATQAGETTRQALTQYPVGGLIYFSKNIYDEEQLTTMIRNSQSYSEIPLFIRVDEEGGSLVARIANHPNFDVEKFPDMAEIGATGHPPRAYEVGSTIASYLKDYGFNLDFAPDADVLTNPNNTAIGVRSFGSDPDMTAHMVEQAVKGFQDHQVSAVIKHFPGHGGTTTDSHNGAAIVDRSLEELRSAEFLPFEAGIQAGVDMVMVGHLQVPQVISDDTPASLSSEMITDVLRNELGYDGIVITDSLSMGAITTYYTSADAAVKCIQAGVDMLLMPYSFTEAYQGVLDAVNSGEISEERINEPVTCTLKLNCKNLY